MFPLPEKKMMKKYANKVVAAAMAVTMMVPMVCTSVMAADDNTKSTTVKYGVTTSYEWSVPSEIDFTNATDATVTANDETGNTQKVKVTKNVIPEGQKLQITAKGSGTDGAFTIAAEGTGKSHILSYSIKSGNTELSVNGVVLAVNAGTNTGNAELTFKLTKDETEMADNDVVKIG